MYIDMCLDTYAWVRTDMCVDVCVGMCVDVCVGMCIDVSLHM